MPPGLRPGQAAMSVLPGNAARSGTKPGCIGLPLWKPQREGLHPAVQIPFRGRNKTPEEARAREPSRGYLELVKASPGNPSAQKYCSVFPESSEDKRKLTLEVG